jgi:hypothetical protein
LQSAKGAWHKAGSSDKEHNYFVQLIIQGVKFVLPTENDKKLMIARLALKLCLLL